MWWQYVVTLIIALIAVWFSHWLSGKHEYRKAINGVRGEIAANIQTCYYICGTIDIDLNPSEEGEWTASPYPPLHELAWSTWKSVILLRNSELAAKIEVDYFCVPVANNFLYRIEELKWGLVAALAPKAQRMEHFESAKSYISEILLPRLKEAKELLEKECQGWLKKLFWC